MNLLEEKILEEIKQRTNEISALRTILSHTPASQQVILRKYMIPAFYSLWEGYVKKSFEIYIKEINSLSLHPNDLHPQLFAYAVDNHPDVIKLKNLSDFHQREQYIEYVRQALKDTQVRLPVVVSTESNVNLKIVNRLLFRFNLEELPEEPFKKQLNLFLYFRNGISHGDAIPIDEKEHIEPFSQLVINLMHEIFLKISEGYVRETYRSPSPTLSSNPGSG